MKSMLSLLLLCSGAALAQDEAAFNKLSVDVLKPLNITFNNAYELLQPKVLPTALGLNLKIKQENVGVYAQVGFQGLNNPLPDQLALRLSSKTSQDAVVGNAEVFLSNQPALLFMQPRSPQATKFYSYYFDLVVDAKNKMITPGQHPFTINFTITAQ